MEVNFTKDKILVNGKLMVFPSKLEDIVKILGKPSRTDSFDKYEYTVFWDDLGLLVRFYDQKEIEYLHIRMDNPGKDMFANKPFEGDIFVEGVLAENENAKYKMENYYLSIHIDNKTRKINFVSADRYLRN